MAPVTVVAIVSDTHLPRGERRLPDACLERLRTADLVLHAGDIATAAVLRELEGLGPPVHAVGGNQDEPALLARLSERCVVDVGAVRIGMVHDAGPAAGRLARQRRAFPECDAVRVRVPAVQPREPDGSSPSTAPHDGRRPRAGGRDRLRAPAAVSGPRGTW